MVCMSRVHGMRHGMIQFLVRDTYPTYSVSFYRLGNPVIKIYDIYECDLDKMVFGFSSEDTEQIFEEKYNGEEEESEGEEEEAYWRLCIWWSYPKGCTSG